MLFFTRLYQRLSCTHRRLDKALPFFPHPSPQPDACAMAAGDEKNPLNQMRLQERQNPSVGQSEPLPTERKASTIPMADFRPAHQDEAAKVGKTLPSESRALEVTRQGTVERSGRPFVFLQSRTRAAIDARGAQEEHRGKPTYAAQPLWPLWQYILEGRKKNAERNHNTQLNRSGRFGKRVQRERSSTCCQLSVWTCQA
jgi:hypothetical protein